MTNQLLLLLAVGVPLSGPLLLPIVGRFHEGLRNMLALLMVATSLFCSCQLLPAVWGGETVSLLGAGVFPTLLTADLLAVFMAIASSLIGGIIVFYSFDYIRSYPHRNEYYTLVVLFLGSMMGIVYSHNLLLLYFFWELTAFCSWRLIGFFREKLCVARADKAFLITVFGALMMLIAIIAVYEEHHSFDLTILKGAEISSIVVILFLCGIFSKSATLPFHTWLPDAGVAPSPVTALLHAAVLVKIGVYVYARLMVATFDLAPEWNIIIPIIAAASALLSAGAALVETDIKRIVAFSTISQIGFIFLGLSIGGELALVGALLYILMHGLAKAGLFLCAGIIEHSTHTKDITQMGGLMKKLPITAISFLFCAFSVMGIPPFGGFFSKYNVLTAAFISGHYGVAFLFLFGAILTMVYLLRLFRMVFLGEMGRSSINASHEHSWVMVGSVALLALLSLLGGIFIHYPATFAEITARQMLGGLL